MHFGSEQKKSSMRVFNQTIWEQIDMSMGDADRVIEKSRMPMEDSPRIGKLETPGAGDDDTDDGDGDGDGDGSNGNQGPSTSTHDEEVYDDRAFYSMLLKTFITSSISTSNSASMRASDIEAMRMYKKKKQVDRKASKGRKIRYVVHTKLQNFMFPIPTMTTESIDEDRLFASLFQ
jgi:protein AATF/BFR2